MLDSEHMMGYCEDSEHMTGYCEDHTRPDDISPDFLNELCHINRAKAINIFLLIYQTEMEEIPPHSNISPYQVTSSPRASLTNCYLLDGVECEHVIGLCC